MSWKLGQKRSGRRLRRDTTPDAVAAQVAVMKRLSPSRRMEIAIEMSEEMAEVAKAGQRSRSAALPNE